MESLAERGDAGSQARWQALAGVAVVVVPAREDMPARLAEGSLAVTACDSLLADWLAGLPAQAVLVRPDHCVYGAATDAAALATLLRQLATALGRG